MAKRKKKKARKNGRSRKNQKTFYDYTKEEQPVSTAVKEEAAQQVAATSNEVELPPHITVRDLAQLVGRSPIDIIKTLMNLGVMAHINQTLDYETAAIVLEELGFKVREAQPEIVEAEGEGQESIKTLR